MSTLVHKKVLKCLLQSKTCDFTSLLIMVCEIELRMFVFRDVLGIKRAGEIFKPVRETHRTCMSHKIIHISKRITNDFPKKRNSQVMNSITSIQFKLVVIQLLEKINGVGKFTSIFFSCFKKKNKNEHYFLIYSMLL